MAEVFFHKLRIFSQRRLEPVWKVFRVQKIMHHTSGGCIFNRVCYLVPMRVIGEIPHPECKITIFHWNNRYLIKLEQGLLEQTYKIQEYDVSSEEELRSLITTDFLQAALQQFGTMRQTLQDALGKI